MASPAWPSRTAKTNVMLSGYYSESDSMQIADRPELASRGLNAIIGNYPTLISSTTLPYSFGTTPNIVASNGGLLTLRDGTPLNSGDDLYPHWIYRADRIRRQLVSQCRRRQLCPARYYRPACQCGFSAWARWVRKPTVKSFGVVARRQMTEQPGSLRQNISTPAMARYARGQPDRGQLSHSPAPRPTNPFRQAVTISIPTDICPALRNGQHHAACCRRRSDGSAERLAWRGGLHLELGAVRTTAVSASTRTRFRARLNTGVVNPFVDTLSSPLDLSPYYAPFAYTAPSSLDDFAVRLPVRYRRWWAGSPTLAIGIGHRTEGLDNGHFHRVSANFPSERLHAIHRLPEPVADHR